MDQGAKPLKFREALSGFRPLCGRKNEVALIFSDATYGGKAKAKLAGIESFGQNDVLFCLGDTIDVYERRQDEFNGLTALLFDPNSPHIRIIRGKIEYVKENHAEGTPEYNAAAVIETGLNDVQGNRYLPHAMANPGFQLHVINYGNGGITAREYGQWESNDFKGAVVLDVGSECLIPNLQEGNALQFHSHSDNATPIDILIIDSMGNKSYCFNHLMHEPGSEGGFAAIPADLRRAIDQKVLEISGLEMHPSSCWGEYKKTHYKPGRYTPHDPREVFDITYLPMLDSALEQVMPDYCKKHPPKVDTKATGRKFG